MGTVIDIAAIAMGREMQRVEFVAHNIANATTPGFKRRLDAALAAVNSPKTASGVDVLSAQTDLTQGRLVQTGDPMHLALSGPGFFAVRSGNQISYTRGGAFARDGEGRLVSAENLVLQGDGGDVIVRPGAFKVMPDGTVIQDDRPLDRVRVVDVADKSLLQRGPKGGFFADVEANVGRVDDPFIQQGYLEMGNVDLGHEMVTMMEAFRRFELGQKLIQSYEDMIGGAVRRLGDLQT